MKVFIYKGFIGHYPVGTSAVIVADSREHAFLLLDKQLTNIGLNQTESLDIEKFVELKTDEPSCVISNDGDY